jgi:hypothetical protein
MLEKITFQSFVDAMKNLLPLLDVYTEQFVPFFLCGKIYPRRLT